MSGRRWRVPASPPDEARAREDARVWGVPLPLARLLRSRGFASPEEVDAFLRPRLSRLDDPLALPDMPAAVDRIHRALAARERIAVFGDYDVDGLTATALVVQVLRALGADAHPFLPKRVEEGYGLRADSLQRCLDELKPGLLLTVDCGTNAVEAVEMAQAAGTDVVITDHHLPIEGRRPAAAAVVNPRYAPEGVPWRELAGVGVAFKLVHALVKTARRHGVGTARELDLRRWLDWVALGTVADVVPLIGENRILARHGFDKLNREPSPGLRALMHVARVRGPVSTYHVGFLLAPRLNAAGRLATAMRALRLLLEADEATARTIADELEAANRERQRIESATLEEARRRVEQEGHDRRAAIVVEGRGWHPGVIGLVASRLASEFARPTVVFAVDDEGRARGSGRSPDGFHLLDAIRDCADLLLSFGGHAQAAGLTMRADGIETFRRRFVALAEKRLAGADLRPVVQVDQWISLAEADESLLEALSQMQPFGPGNPTPVWATRGVRILEPRAVGPQGRHLRCWVADGGVQRAAIGFQQGGRPLPDGQVDVAFELHYDEFNGERSVRLHLVDVRPAEPSAPPSEAR